jgi:predicted dehydrogenase
MSLNNTTRRDFLRGVTLSSLGLALSVEEIAAHAVPDQGTAGSAKPAGPPVKVGVIGLGPRGRDILTSLARLGPAAPVVAICDSFQAPPFLKRSKDIAPTAAVESDYKNLLSNKEIQAVFIATPSHKHKQIVLDAIQAGKHVYCEAPLASDMAEAKEIAVAGKGAKTVFQSGLQNRCNNQAVHVNNFIRSSATGKMTGGRAQWHKRTSWKQAYPDAAREAELNWRLKKASSSGLLGEIGIHQIDTASWYFKSLPLSVTGFGGILELNDGRDVPDTIQAVFEYPNNVRFAYDATLTNSFDDAYELFLGTDAAVILREIRGWMFKEASAAQLGWEVFARKDILKIGNPEAGSGLQLATGIALVADASKQLALGKDPAKMATDVTRTPLHQSIEVFLNSCRAGKLATAVEPTREHPNPPLAPGADEGYQATVVAIKANEAVNSGGKIILEKEWFTL